MKRHGIVAHTKGHFSQSPLERSLLELSGVHKTPQRTVAIYPIHALEVESPDGREYANGIKEVAGGREYFAHGEPV